MKKKYLLYQIARPIITIFIKLIYKPQIHGTENIILNDKCILAGNHTSNFDALLVMSSTKRTIRFLAKKELHKSVFGILFRSAGTIPVDRSKKDEKAKAEAINALNNKELICIFPEGTINKTKDLIIPFKYGAVSFASKTDTKIVPFIIKGKYKIFRRNIEIKYLTPITINRDNLEQENIKLMNIIKEELKNE